MQWLHLELNLLDGNGMGFKKAIMEAKALTSDKALKGIGITSSIEFVPFLFRTVGPPYTTK
jgi:hypothetical protein